MEGLHLSNLVLQFGDFIQAKVFYLGTCPKLITKEIPQKSALIQTKSEVSGAMDEGQDLDVLRAIIAVPIFPAVRIYQSHLFVMAYRLDR